MPERLEGRRLLAVLISEFAASNTAGLTDQDLDHSDWIELANTSAAPADVSDWYLSDDAANLVKWQIPLGTTIPANGYLTIFASGKNRAIAGQELHTNFSLSAAGEDVVLTQSDGTTVADSFVGYPAQLADKTYGHAKATSTTSAVTLVGDTSPLKVISPSAINSARDDYWQNVGFDDSTWISGVNSVGFDRTQGSTTAHGLFTPYLGTTLTTTQMPSVASGSIAVQTSAYIRYTFNVADKAQFSSLVLNLRYDDGYYLWLNGKFVQNLNVDNSLRASWNSRASDVRTNSTVITPTAIDLTQWIEKLNNGANVLAIQATNSVGSVDVADLLIDPNLVATRATGEMTGFMASPTPGAANGVGTLGFVGDTHFSVDRGFFDAAFPVAITSTTPGASIRYTTNGTLPTETTGTLYTGPITISNTTTLRAIAYKSGYVSSNADTETYLFLNSVIQQSATGLQPFAGWSHFTGSPGDWEMDPDIVNSPTYSTTIKNDLKAIPTVSVVMDWNDLFGATPQGIYSNNVTKNRESLPRANSIEYFNAAGTDQWHADTSIEIQGGSSAIRWRDDKLSFQVKFKFPYGQTKLNYNLFTNPLTDKNVATEFDTFILDAQYNYTFSVSDAAQHPLARYVTDQVMADLQNATSGGAAHGKWVHLYLNGLYWGVYNLHERPDADFASTYYGNDAGDYDVIKHSPTGIVDGGVTATENYATFLAATRQNMAVQANYDVVANQYLDVDEFIDYMLVHYYGGNFDWGGDNYYASHSRAVGGKWRYHEWDQEQAFADVNFDTTTYTAAANNITGGPIEVHYNLLANPEYKLKFADHVQKLYFNGGVLTPASVTSFYQNRMTELDRAIVGESARWGDNRATTPYTRANWLTTANNTLNNFVAQRTTISYNQFVARGWLQALAAPVFSSYGNSNINTGFQLTMSKPVGSPVAGVIYYTTDGSDPRLAGGAISGTASAYTGPLTLNASTRVQARIFDGANWSPIIDARFVLTGGNPIRIVEMNYHPANHSGVVDADDLEFIELLNTSSQTVSLAGMTLGAGVSYTFPAGVSLGANQRIVVVRNRTVFQSVYGTGVNLAPGVYTGKLDNAGEQVILSGGLGESLQNFIYDDNAPWPTSPDGGGPTLEIIDPLGNPSSAANWQASAVNDGTPGQASTPIDTTPPTVVSASFDVELGRYTIQFSEDVADLTLADLQLLPQPSGLATSASALTYNAATFTATFDVTSIPDGRYVASLLAGSVTDIAGNPLANNFNSAAFGLLRGDVNLDGTVTFDDLLILVQNYLQIGRTFTQGNVNYSPDGLVNFDDLLVLVQSYGTSLVQGGVRTKTRKRGSPLEEHFV